MQLADAKYAVIALVTLGIVLTIAALITDTFKSSSIVSVNYKDNRTINPGTNKENFSANTESHAVLKSKVVQTELIAINITGSSFKNDTLPTTNYTLTCSTDGEACTVNITEAEYRTSSPVASIWLVYNFTTPRLSTPYNTSVNALSTFESSAKFMPLVGIVIFGAVVLGLVSYFGFAE